MASAGRSADRPAGRGRLAVAFVHRVLDGC